jgi:asparagine synthase (glutamine-hydrolysing)
MGKRSAVRRVRAEYEGRRDRDNGAVHLSVIEGGWDPVADDQRHARKRKRAPAQNTHQHTEHREPQREQAYVKNVMPKSEGQARLIEAIERSNLVLALGPAGLAMRRLAIVDLPGGHQPLANEDNTVWIVFNGEIYNFAALRADLEARGHVFRTRSDTEAIVHAYEEFGDDCVLRLRGMFAFAIWDEQQQTLFAARDRFGEKPFYYTWQDQTLAFASEIKAFWALGIPKQVDANMAFNYLTLGYVDDPHQPHRTFFQQIHILPAAHRLQYSAIYRTATLERYWDLDVFSVREKISEAEAQLQFRELLRRSVQHRLRSDVPIGCSLSGGLDSSSLASLMSEQGNSTLSTFTAIFPEKALSIQGFFVSAVIVLQIWVPVRFRCTW